MEFKKKTIIWEDNSEPPKDYIWAKKDGKFYEYNYATRSWVESESISGGSGGSGGSGSGEHGGSGKISINEGLKRVYKTLYNIGEEWGEYENIQFPDAYAHYEGSDEYTLIEDDFVTLVETFLQDEANGSLEVYPVYKNPPYESENKYAVKDNDKLYLLRSESLGYDYRFFLETVNHAESEKFYNTSRIDVSTESGTESYYTLSIWKDESEEEEEE